MAGAGPCFGKGPFSDTSRPREWEARGAPGKEILPPVDRILSIRSTTTLQTCKPRAEFLTSSDIGVCLSILCNLKTCTHCGSCTPPTGMSSRLLKDNLLIKLEPASGVHFEHRVAPELMSTDHLLPGPGRASLGPSGGLSLQKTGSHRERSKHLGPCGLRGGMMRRGAPSLIGGCT